MRSFPLDRDADRFHSTIVGIRPLLLTLERWGARSRVDGQWTDELPAALQAFQTELGVEPTGVVDPATLAAFQQAVSELAGAATATTSPTTIARPATTPTTGWRVRRLTSRVHHSWGRDDRT